MVLKLNDKKAIVSEVAEVVKQAVSIVGANYSGLTVGQLTQLRRSARSASVKVDVRIVRNTLARRAVEGTPFACIQPSLIGSLILVFSKDDPGAAARLVKDFMKQNEKMTVKFLALENELLSSDNLSMLASLPTRDEAIAQLMSVILAPVTKLVRTMAEPHSKLVRTIAAIRDQKEKAA